MTSNGKDGAKATDKKTTLPSAQRNSGEKGSLLEGFGFPETETYNPGEALFEIGDIKDLVVRGDIPEKMVPLLTRMLWKAERFRVSALEDLVKWYLLTRLGTNRAARREYMEVTMNAKKPGDEDEELLKKL